MIVRDGRPGRQPLFGSTAVFFFVLGRVILVLPFLSQPRFPNQTWLGILGGALFMGGIVFSSAAIAIRPFTAPSKKMAFKTTGLYGIVRNPIYLGEILWTLGWSLMFRSIYGVCMVPFWWVGLLFIVRLEEKSLEQQFGQSYRDYKKRVTGRILPGLPV
jgi:protein-S-isoprenylcysteine O-methyltransferase Ste14